MFEPRWVMARKEFGVFLDMLIWQTSEDSGWVVWMEGAMGALEVPVERNLPKEMKLEPIF